MQRTPEPELMDGLEQARAYAAADFSAGDQALVDHLGVLFPSGLGSRLLDLGCGPGNISFRLAAQYPEAEVIGVDGAAAMLALAEQRLQAQISPSLRKRLRFQLCCLPSTELPQACTAVVSNSLLHHLHDPQVLWGCLPHCAAPGSLFYLKDLRRPVSPEEAIALQQRHLADAPPVLQYDYLASLHAAFTVAEVQAQLELVGLADQLQVAVLDDRYLEVWGRLF
jgi:trans-aconitate 2-methyltransferase